MGCWNPSTLYTNMGLQELPVGIPLPYIQRGLEEWGVGIPLPYIPIWDYKSCLLESLYLTYQYGITRVACWNPSTSNTNRRVQEWPAGIPLPHILALIIGHGNSFIIHSKPFCEQSRFDPLIYEIVTF